jgi:polyisoprenoid-binding protein YceI
MNGAARLLCLLLLAGADAARADGRPASFTLDPAHSWVHFELAHFGTSTIRGRLGPARGSVMLDATAGRGAIDIEIATASIDTGLALFDARIRRSDLLDTENHPTAWFVARALRFDGARLAEVRGEFTLRGISQPLTLVATRFGCHPHPALQREVCGGDFEAEIQRSDFGIDFGLPFVGDTVTLRVQVEGVRDADGARVDGVRDADGAR